MTEMNTATATMTENNNKGQTVKFDLAEQLARKMSISLEDAKAALEKADWNTLTATHLLEQEEFRRKQALNETAESCAGNDNAAQGNPSAESTATSGKVTQDSPDAEKKTAARQKKWFSNVCDHLRCLVAYGNRNRFTVTKDGDRLLEMPVTALAILLLLSFGTCVPLMIVGLFAGCRYSITTAVEA